MAPNRTLKFVLRKITLLSFYLLILGETASSQCKSFNFSRITTQDGLSDQVVTSIAQDSTGFIWFGTTNGLNRYDGFRLRAYQHNVFNSNTISNNNIKDLLVDNSGDLWIATDDGVNKFNVDKDNFTNYRQFPSDSFLQVTRNTQCLAQDKDGVIWLGTIGSGLIAFQPETNNFVQFRHNEDDVSSLASNTVSDLMFDRNGTLWIGTPEGLSVLENIQKKKLWNTSSQLIFNNYFEGSGRGSLASSTIQCIYEDSKNNIWIGTDKGLSQLIPGNRNIMWFDNYYHNDSDMESLPTNYIWTVFEDSKKNLWVGTEEGLALAKPSNQKRKLSFCNYLQDLSDPQGLINSTVRTITEVKPGILFMGTFGGINVLNLKHKKFVNYSPYPDKKRKTEVKDVFEDNDIMWMATWHGLIKYNVKTNNYILYQEDSTNPFALSNDHVWTVTGDDQGNIWVGTSNGINKLNKTTGKFTQFKHSQENENSLTNNTVNCLNFDSKKRLWVGTNKGISIINKTTHPTFSNYIPVRSPQLPTDNSIYDIYVDSKGNGWLATGSGIYVFNQDSGTFISYRHIPDNPNSLISDNVSCITEFPERTFWIGTDEGMDKFLPDSNKFEHFLINNGLPNNQIMAILHDNRNDLWISTSMGLSKFDLSSGKFTNFFESDGLESSIFTAGASESKQGEMLFANYKGVLGFFPDSIYLNNYVPNIVITEFMLFNRPVRIGDIRDGRVILKQPINRTHNLVLSYKDYVFTFEFTALSYMNPEYNRFSYKMEGFDNQWQEKNTNMHYATYTNLNPGKYIFRVKGSNNDGIWNEKGTSLNIIITPPYYKTLWFRISIVLLIVFLILLTYYLKIRSMQSQRLLLQAKVEERTKELTEVNNKLKEQHWEIRQQKEILEKQKEKITLVNKSLEEFSYVVSHDLKAPLRGIRQLSLWLAQDFNESLNEDGHEIIRLLTRRVDKMNKLIEGILQYSRIGKKPAVIEKIDLNKLVKDIIEMISPPDNIKIEIKQPLPQILADITQMEQVFLNLISNAVKFIDKPQGEVKIGYTDKKDFYEFSISDNGIGIDKKFHEKIFGVFQTLSQERENQDTGIGLTIVKKIIQMRGGDIWLNSAPGSGTTFYFTVPKKIVNS